MPDQRVRYVVGETVGHDAGADDRGNQEGRAQGLRGEAAFQVERHVSACLRNGSADLVQSLLQGELVEARLGRLVKIERRLLSMR